MVDAPPPRGLSPPPLDLVAPTPPPPPALTLLWRARGWRLLPVLALFIASVAVAAPGRPSVAADWFASRAAGRRVACGGPAEPPACGDARAAAVLAAAVADLVGFTVLGAAVAPALGAASDRGGRKPLLVAGLAASALPPLALWGAATRRASLFLYYAASAAANAVPLTAAALAMAADWLPAPRRAAAFGCVSASLYGGLLAGSAVGAALAPAPAAALAAVGALAAAAAAAATVPESLPPAARAAALAADADAGAGARPLTARAALTAGVRVLARSSLYRTLAAVVVLTGAAGAGLNELFAQYLAARLAFDTTDQAAALAVFALGGLAVQALLLPRLVARVGEARALAAGVAAAAALQAGLAVAGSRGAALAVLAVGSASGLILPAASALKANNAPAHEQGAMQGVLAAASGAASGIGPILYGGIYYVCGRPGARAALYAPAAPFAVGAALCGGALALALTLPPGAGRGVAGCDSWGQQGGSEDGGERGVLVGEH